MEDIEKKHLLQLLYDAHSMVEKAYTLHPAKKDNDDWLQKRKWLLADLSLHMAIAGTGEEPDTKKIKQYLYALLTICQDFLPEVDLKSTAEALLPSGDN